jgi:hypothetical protein
VVTPKPTTAILALIGTIPVPHNQTVSRET